MWPPKNYLVSNKVHISGRMGTKVPLYECHHWIILKGKSVPDNKHDIFTSISICICILFVLVFVFVFPLLIVIVLIIVSYLFAGQIFVLVFSFVYNCVYGQIFAHARVFLFQILTLQQSYPGIFVSLY